MARKLARVLLALLSISSDGRAQEAALRKIKLAPGETQAVSFPEGSDLTVSRRGVVDLHHSGKGVWQLTGLRTGLAAIGQKGGEPGDRLIVEVVAPPEPAAPAAPPTAVVPEWICAPAGIACHREAGLVTGTAASPDWFLHARRTCAATAGCSFQVRLAPDGRRQWTEAVQGALGDAHRVSMADGDVLVVDAPCAAADVKAARAEVDALTRGMVTEGSVHVRCRPPDRRYRLAARVFLVEDATAKQLGFDADATLTVAARPWLADAAFASRLQALAAERKARILGEPVVPLPLHEEVRLATGGEFQVLDHPTGRDDEPRASWKQHGLALAVTGTPLPGGRVRLGYDLALRSRASSGDAALSLNTLRSSIELTPGEPAAAGVLDLSSEDERNTARPILASLPIVGPLFASQGTAGARSRLVLWLTVTEDPPSKR